MREVYEGVSDLDELDKPYVVVRDDGDTLMYAANFRAMSPERRKTWPDRTFQHWRRERLPLLVLPLILGALTGWLDQSWSVGIGAAGLILDILGAWMLSESILLKDEEADSYVTYGGAGENHVRKRDSRQARFALLILSAGFIAQFVGLVLAAWPNAAR